MKKFITSSALLVAFALLSTGAFAANNTKTNGLGADAQVFAAVTYYSNSCNIDITLDKLTPGNSVLRIYDENGNLLLKDDVTINAETVTKSYLLDDLVDGDYTIEVTSNNEVVEQDLTLNSQETTEQVYTF